MADAEDPTAYMFPGHGARAALHEELVVRYAPDLLAAAQRGTCHDLFGRAHECQRFAQPAIYCASIAAWRALQASGEGHRPYVLAGHSLGEISALVAAGSLPADIGLELVTRRGAVMDVEATSSARGRMLALVGTGASALIDDPGIADVYLASDNAPDHVVAAGTVRGIEALQALARNRRFRAVMLPAAAAGHCPLMRTVELKLAELLRTVEFKPGVCDVWSGISGAPIRDPRVELARAVVQPVAWRKLTSSLRDLGVNRFVDVGPGRMLAGFVAKTLPTAQSVAIDEVLGIDRGTVHAGS